MINRSDVDYGAEFRRQRGLSELVAERLRPNPYFRLSTSADKSANFISGVFKTFRANVCNLDMNPLLAILSTRNAEKFCVDARSDILSHIVHDGLAIGPQVYAHGRTKRTSVMIAGERDRFSRK